MQCISPLLLAINQTNMLNYASKEPFFIFPCHIPPLFSPSTNISLLIWFKVVAFSLSSSVVSVQRKDESGSSCQCQLALWLYFGKHRYTCVRYSQAYGALSEALQLCGPSPLQLSAPVPLSTCSEMVDLLLNNITILYCSTCRPHLPSLLL